MRIRCMLLRRMEACKAVPSILHCSSSYSSVVGEYIELWAGEIGGCAACIAICSRCLAVASMVMQVMVKINFSTQMYSNAIESRHHHGFAHCMRQLLHHSRGLILVLASHAESARSRSFNKNSTDVDLMLNNCLVVRHLEAGESIPGVGEWRLSIGT